MCRACEAKCPVLIEHPRVIVDLRRQLVDQGRVDEGLWRFAMPPELAPVMAPKGSVAVDGISLTVVDCGTDWFTVALIPETVKRTALDAMRPGDPVNLEADPIGRFVARALALRNGEEKLTAFVRRGWP